MFKTLTLAAVALATAMVFGNSSAQANPKVYRCVKPNTAAIVDCTKSEYHRYIVSKLKRQREFQQEDEMAAEQRAYDKMKKERQQKATTTEHCYMKNGQLECKQVP